ncbi:MAG TPA: CAP domain-containing protein [Spirochaetia bacterium]|nr:CAP domain-containing protein [Spirochaetia bacterium]
MLSLVNQQRVANSLPAYTVNSKLSYLAHLRAQDMANHQVLTHYSPTYGTPPQMEETAGIYGNPMGAENICEGPSVTVDNSALFNSPPHRANLLDPQETQIGLGVVQSSNGIVWVSELFLGN